MSSPDVLVVEDDPEINRLVGAYVEICGCNYRPALDGAAAIAAAQSRVPDVIILDLMLPDLDGFEICRQIKSSCDCQSVSVIMLTALDTAESRQKGRQCGAVEYLTKPFDPEKFMQTLTYHACVGGRN